MREGKRCGHTLGKHFLISYNVQFNPISASTSLSPKAMSFNICCSSASTENELLILNVLSKQRNNVGIHIWTNTAFRLYSMNVIRYLLSEAEQPKEEMTSSGTYPSIHPELVGWLRALQSFISARLTKSSIAHYRWTHYYSFPLPDQISEDNGLLNRGESRPPNRYFRKPRKLFIPWTASFNNKNTIGTQMYPSSHPTDRFDLPFTH